MRKCSGRCIVELGEGFSPRRSCTFQKWYIVRSDKSPCKLNRKAKERTDCAADLGN